MILMKDDCFCDPDVLLKGINTHLEFFFLMVLIRQPVGLAALETLATFQSVVLATTTQNAGEHVRAVLVSAHANISY